MSQPRSEICGPVVGGGGLNGPFFGLLPCGRVVSRQGVAALTFWPAIPLHPTRCSPMVLRNSRQRIANGEVEVIVAAYVRLVNCAVAMCAAWCRFAEEFREVLTYWELRADEVVTRGPIFVG